MTQLNDLVQILGPANVITGADADSYVEDWRGRYRGQALAVARPGNTQEVAQVVKWCAANKVPIVPQGGNTGLCGAATPDSSGTALVLSLARLNRIRGIDTDNDTMEVEAGCILQQVQQAARDAQRLFPLSLAAEG
ncbi:FAD-binding oxidoreductase, partial [Pusillimonas noertemannii]